MKHRYEENNQTASKNVKVDKKFDLASFLDSYEEEGLNEEEKTEHLTEALMAAYSKGYNTEYILMMDIRNWQKIAVINSLKKNNIIKKLCIDESQEDFSLQFTEYLKELLINNTTLCRFELFQCFSNSDDVNSDDVNSDDINTAICNGIKSSKSLKEVSITGIMSWKFANSILEAINSNNNIVSLELEGVFLDNVDTLMYEFIKVNKSLVKFTMTYSSDDISYFITNSIQTMDKAIDFPAMIKALKVNNSLHTVIIKDREEEEFGGMTLSSEVILKFKELFSINHTLCVLDGIYEVGRLMENNPEIDRLLVRNDEDMQNLISSIKALNFNINSNPLSPEHINVLFKIEKMSQNLLRQQLLEVDWSNEEFVRKYAILNRVDKLKNYNIKKDFAKFTQEQREKWQKKFENYSQFYDKEQDSEVLKLIEQIQEYRNANLLHLNLICKNSNTIFPNFIWAKIASYLSFDDIAHTNDGQQHILPDDLLNEHYQVVVSGDSFL